jgi:hypothetical protein
MTETDCDTCANPLDCSRLDKMKAAANPKRCEGWKDDKSVLGHRTYT